ncbi:hypothetical protein ACFRJ1_06965 [Streptomyces sp. NPDC056773]|uniref:hypothetical protein n=1 Tax=unclassified Streptomyces TaxID=2593676 RepID=UPI0036CBDF65
MIHYAYTPTVADAHALVEELAEAAPLPLVALSAFMPVGTHLVLDPVEPAVWWIKAVGKQWEVEAAPPGEALDKISRSAESAWAQNPGARSDHHHIVNTLLPLGDGGQIMRSVEALPAHSVRHLRSCS